MACCPGVEDEDLRRLFLEPARDLQDGLGRARRLLRSRRARPYVLLFPRPQRAILPRSLLEPVADAASAAGESGRQPDMADQEQAERGRTHARRVEPSVAGAGAACER